MKKILYLILFLTLILVGCTWYQIREVKTEFGDYEHKIDSIKYISEVAKEESGVVCGYFVMWDFVQYPCDESPRLELFTEKQRSFIREGVISEIKEEAQKHNINPAKALDIAFCESRYNPFATSKKSSAKGVYQFTDRTWNKYCNGDPLSQTDNINCFLKLYPKHKNWWVCKG